jgi:hypothetical protein
MNRCAPFRTHTRARRLLTVLQVGHREPAIADRETQGPLMAQPAGAAGGAKQFGAVFSSQARQPAQSATTPPGKM